MIQYEHEAGPWKVTSYIEISCGFCGWSICWTSFYIPDLPTHQHTYTWQYKVLKEF